MRYKAVLFDLDGTLLDTLGDLHGGVNLVLGRHGYPLRSVEEIRSFVGNGARELIRLALPEGTDSDTVDGVWREYADWYAVHYRTNAVPYAGVAEVLAALQAAGVAAAVVSNKPHATTAALAAMFFPGLPAIGQQEGVPKKPAPDMVRLALEQLGASAEESVYVGDSEVDAATARNAGLPLVAVSWGFRSEEQLRSAGAETVAATAEELLAYLT